MVKLDVVPMGKPRMTQRDRWKQRPVVLRYHTYCDELRLRLPGYELPPHLYISFYIPMPPSWSKKKRETMNEQPHQQKPDIDNLAKAFMDAFKSDDSHVHHLEAAKVWSIEPCIKLYNTD